MFMLAWTPLVTADMFTGLNTDLGVMAAGIATGLVIVLGIGMIMRGFH